MKIIQNITYQNKYDLFTTFRIYLKLGFTRLRLL